MEDLGFFEVVLVDLPYAIPATVGITSLRFDYFSLAPALHYEPVTDVGGFEITRINSMICGPNAISKLELNPASLGSPNGTGANVGAYDTFRLLYSSMNHAIVARHADADGIHPATLQTFNLGAPGAFDPLPPTAVATTPIFGSIAGVGRAVPGYVYKITADTGNNRIAVWNGAGFTHYGAAFNVQGLGTIGLWSGSNFWQVPSNRRNYCFMSANISHPAIHFDYNLDDPGVISPQQEVAWPDPIIQATFVAGNYACYCYYGGFLFVFDTGGTGPTGQPFEVIVALGDFSAFALIKFIGGSASAVTALARTSGVDWTLKVDTDGNLFWTSGHALDVAQVWISGAGPAKQQAANNPPFTLPCFITCDVNFPQQG